MKPSDEASRDLADHAEYQCEALFDKMEAVAKLLNGEVEVQDD